MDEKLTKEKTSRWQKLKKMAVDSYQSAKEKYQNYKIEKDNLEFTENISGVNIDRIDNDFSILRCSICESAIPSELLSTLKEGNSIICEKCGSVIASQTTS